jgi:hypothetical protein
LSYIFLTRKKTKIAGFQRIAPIKLRDYYTSRLIAKQAIESCKRWVKVFAAEMAACNTPAALSAPLR